MAVRIWVGEWRLVGQGLHHTSFTRTIHHSTAPAHLLFCVFSSVSRCDTWLMECLFLWSPLGFADIESVSTKHLRANYGKSVTECVKADVAVSCKWQAGCTSLQIQSSQPCTLRVRTRIPGQPCLPRCLCHETVQSSLLRSLGFWLSTLLIERRAHRKLVRDAVVLTLQLSVCHLRLGLFLVCQKITHLLLNLSAGSKGRSARRCQ